MRLKIALICMKLQAFSKHSVIDAYINLYSTCVVDAGRHLKSPGARGSYT